MLKIINAEVMIGGEGFKEGRSSEDINFLSSGGGVHYFFYRVWARLPYRRPSKSLKRCRPLRGA